MITTKIKFPKFTGVKCSMMPFVQGDSKSLPKMYRPYSKIIDNNFLEKGEIGFLTIDESFVKSGTSQRGYNGSGIKRNVHIEVGHTKEINYWGKPDFGWGNQTPDYGWGSSKPNYSWGGGPSWGGRNRTLLDENTMVLVSNSVSDTCRVWDAVEKSYTMDGDLSDYIDRYPEETGFLMKAGEVAKISIFTPHECVAQTHDSERQFFRIVGKGVRGREEYFTINPLINFH